MSLVGVVAKNKDIQSIKKELKEKNIDIIEINKYSIKNLKNVKFEYIIFLQNINFEKEEYKYMDEIISNANFLIFNSDIKIEVLNKIEIDETTKIITFGFNSKSTITISSIRNEKIIVYIQNDIENKNGEILESQEKQIVSNDTKKIYNKLVVFIIKELHNL